jgi:hypothetical protein
MSAGRVYLQKEGFVLQNDLSQEKRDYGVTKNGVANATPFFYFS